MVERGNITNHWTRGAFKIIVKFDVISARVNSMLAVSYMRSGQKKVSSSMIVGNQIVGQKTKVEYFDHNIDFERCFPPQTCEIVRHLSSTDGSKDWFLLKLEHPFMYRESKNTHLLASSRWHGYEIGGAKPTSVFILLIPSEEFLSEPIDIEKFNHVAWGMVYPNGDS